MASSQIAKLIRVSTAALLSVLLSCSSGGEALEPSDSSSQDPAEPQNPDDGNSGGEEEPSSEPGCRTYYSTYTKSKVSLASVAAPVDYVVSCSYDQAEFVFSCEEVGDSANGFVSTYYYESNELFVSDLSTDKAYRFDRRTTGATTMDTYLRVLDFESSYLISYRKFADVPAASDGGSLEGVGVVSERDQAKRPLSVTEKPPEEACGSVIAYTYESGLVKTKVVSIYDPEVSCTSASSRVTSVYEYTASKFLLRELVTEETLLADNETSIDAITRYNYVYDPEKAVELCF